MFNVGDEVEWEFSPFDFPRWDFSYDLGATGKWKRGKVLEVRSHEFSVDVGMAFPYFFPLPNHAKYEANRKGWVRKVGSAIEKRKILRMVEKREGGKCFFSLV